MSGVPRETVVVVHGTWAGPHENALNWWQPASPTARESFTRKLDDALARRGSPARCWAHCRTSSDVFHWSGANDWLDRTRASSNLLAHLRALDAQGIRYHLVGHSHGGNAIADALPGLDPKTSKLGRVVTLGTPFLDTHGPIQARKRGRERLVRVLSLVFIGAVFAFPLGAQFLDTIEPADRESAEGTLALMLMIVAGIVAWWMNRRRKAREELADDGRGAKDIGLAITSPYDEARQVLHHLRETQNPFAVDENRWSHIWRNVTSSIKQRAEISRIHGVTAFQDMSRTARAVLIFFYGLIIFGPAAAVVSHSEEFAGNLVLSIVLMTILFLFSMLFYVVLGSAFAGPRFYSAFFAPFRWLGHRIMSAASVPNEIATMVVRRNAWKVLQTYALGLHGYGYELPRVAIVPKIDGPWRFVSADLDYDATARAIRRRGDWLHRRLGDVSQALTALTLTATDFQVLLKDISQDATLVHAAYYSDDACIEQIADWIAGAPPRASAMPAHASNHATAG